MRHHSASPTRAASFRLQEPKGPNYPKVEMSGSKPVIVKHGEKARGANELKK